MMSVLLGIVYASFLEWWIHKELFHVKGRNKNSMFAFHLRDHHAVAKKNNYKDTRVSLIETGGLFALSLLHLPIFFFSPLFYVSICLYAVAFIILHNYGHRNPDWAKKYQAWHHDHHMKNPNTNWNVVLPVADWIMGTNK